ncbi:PREDICTED: 28S ribosomal protein S18a, mitochondrial [Ceratosolen solmsi marchali]|uniref:28S ribosomal protein S18a, mitochondrial n=1 Tax=Ceratosolen solmsi marchali TaxID=326594 RepID=A0AAJ7E1R7_9HYME|nr:PREDICTED: 28S ribosomal protein S18a, mitochondrial [Ceratosolen solmsi marchali]
MFSFPLFSYKFIEKKQGNTTIVDAVIKSHPKQHLLLKQSDNGACCLCSTNVNIKHTDVLILSQFVKSNGQILPRYVTGLCYVQQKRIGILITMAQKAGLMPNLGPANSKKNPKTRYQYKRFNTYYDETSIKQNYY